MERTYHQSGGENSLKILSLQHQIRSNQFTIDCIETIDTLKRASSILSGRAEVPAIVEQKVEAEVKALKNKNWSDVKTKLEEANFNESNTSLFNSPTDLINETFFQVVEYLKGNRSFEINPIDDVSSHQSAANTRDRYNREQ